MPLHDQLTDAQRARLVTLLLAALATADVPEHLGGGLVRYFRDGILPGGFLQAVLCNDLRQATRRGDPWALRRLADLVDVLVEVAPAAAWGSRDAVLAWTTTPDRLEI